MTLTNEQVENIKSEFNQWKDKIYANKTLSERQDFGQFRPILANFSPLFWLVLY